MRVNPVKCILEKPRFGAIPPAIFVGKIAFPGILPPKKGQAQLQDRGFDVAGRNLT